MILPAGAVVVGVAISDAGAGTCDLGATGYTSGTADNNYIASGLAVSAIGTVVAGVTNAALTEMSYVTVTDNTSASGTVAGYLLYFVVDPLAGQQNV